MLNIANELNVDANQILDCMFVKEEDHVSRGQMIAQNKGIFGLFKRALQRFTLVFWPADKDP